MRSNGFLSCGMAVVLGLAAVTCGLVRTAGADDKSFRPVETAQDPAQTRRTALVIGNAKYDASPLRNPVNDARSIAATLQQLGFAVTKLENAGQNEMKEAIDTFGETLKKGGMGLFYYSGHGMQVKGRNYMIPIGAHIRNEQQVEYESVDAGRVLANMDAAGNGLNLVILDACRDNPFGRSFRSTASGLAQMDAPSGTLIAYATSPGKVASDGSGRNGLYTEQLLLQMRTPGVPVEEMFKRVRAGVQQKSGNQQTPWEASSLVGEFYFAGRGSTPAAGPGPAAPAGPAQRLDPEEEAWVAIKDSKDPQVFEDFRQAFPNGRFARVAKLKEETLQQAEGPTPGPGPGPAPVVKRKKKAAPAEPQLTAEQWFEKSQALWDDGAAKYSDVSAALHYLDEALRLNPNYRDAWNNRGNAFDQLGDYANAVANYDQALRIQPNAVGYRNRGSAYSRMKQYPRAIEDFNSSLALDPNFGAAYWERAAAYSWMDNFVQQRADLQKACSLHYQMACDWLAQNPEKAQ